MRAGLLVISLYVLVTAALLWTPAAVRGAGLTTEEISSNRQQGERAFRRALELDRSDPESARDEFRRAIMRFELIAGEGGVRNGKLFYNIGNAYFHIGDIGRAILNYRRAELFVPNDANLGQNLEYARSRRLDRIERRQSDRVFKTLFFFHYDLPSQVRLWVFTVSFAASWIAAILLLFGRRAGVRTALVLSAVVSAVFFASLAVESLAISRRPSGVITAGEVIARKGDAETYQPSFTEPLHAGTEFVLVERRDGWWRIEIESGERTWIPSHSGELLFD